MYHFDEFAGIRFVPKFVNYLREAALFLLFLSASQSRRNQVHGEDANLQLRDINFPRTLAERGGKM